MRAGAAAACRRVLQSAVPHSPPPRLVRYPVSSHHRRGSVAGAILSLQLQQAGWGGTCELPVGAPLEPGSSTAGGQRQQCPTSRYSLRQCCRLLQNSMMGALFSRWLYQICSIAWSWMSFSMPVANPSSHPSFTKRSALGVGSSTRLPVLTAGAQMAQGAGVGSRQRAQQRRASCWPSPCPSPPRP